MLEEKLLKFAVSEAKPIAFWRMPQATTSSMCMGLKLQNMSKLIEDEGKGFVLCPFDNQERPAHFIPSDIYYEGETQRLCFSARDAKALYDKFEKTATLNTKLGECPLQDQVDYVELVEKGIDAIAEGKIEKVVLARSKFIDLPKTWTAFRHFQQLKKDYPRAFVALIYTSEYGMWLTATPEVLISKNKEGMLKTVALAGTQRFQANVPLYQSLWTQKEIEEQALVSRFIINQFKKLRFRSFYEDGPKVVQAGHLIHLCTEFTADTKGHRHLVSNMAKLLHPTSAVCGMPRENAQSFIRQNEKLDRALFSGYIGPIGFNNTIHLFVLLRCIRVYDNKAVVYAGAGIVQHSVAKKEFQETEDKMRLHIDTVSKCDVE